MVLPVLLVRVRNLPKHPADREETDMESCPMAEQETQNPAAHTATVAAVAHPMGQAEMEPCSNQRQDQMANLAVAEAAAPTEMAAKAEAESCLYPTTPIHQC